MSKVANLVLARKGVGSIVVHGNVMIMSVATRTTYWTRPEQIATSLKEPLAKAVVDSRNRLPSSTVEVCLRYVA